jgi:hypothetical protein
MTTTKKPNLKAPRYRQVVTATLNKEYYAGLRSRINVGVLSDDELRKVVLTFNETCWNTVIGNRDGIELPVQLGNIFICSTLCKEDKNLDFKKSQTLESAIIHKNWETDGRVAKIFYVNKLLKNQFANSDLWGLTATRIFKRTVAKTYPSQWKKYIELDKIQNVSTLFRKNFVQIDHQKEINIENYNEFDLD